MFNEVLHKIYNFLSWCRVKKYNKLTSVPLPIPRPSTLKQLLDRKNSMSINACTFGKLLLDIIEKKR